MTEITVADEGTEVMQDQRMIDLREGVFTLHFPYDPQLVETVKTIAGRRWNADSKFWTVPVNAKPLLEKFSIENWFVWTQPAAAAKPTGEMPKQEPPRKGKATVDFDKVVIDAPYNPALVTAIKAIEGRRWDASDKVWTVPLSEISAVLELAQQFSLDIVESESSEDGEEPF